MVERMKDYDQIELRWKNRIIAVDDSGDSVRISSR